MEERFSVTDVAQQLGVTTKTITRWEKAGKVKKAKRDWRGWRVYSKDEVEELKSFVETVYDK